MGGVPVGGSRDLLSEIPQAPIAKREHEPGDRPEELRGALEVAMHNGHGANPCTPPRAGINMTSGNLGIKGANEGFNALPNGVLLHTEGIGQPLKLEVRLTNSNWKRLNIDLGHEVRHLERLVEVVAQVIDEAIHAEVYLG